MFLRWKQWKQNKAIECLKICLGLPPMQEAVGYPAGSKIHPSSEVVLTDCLPPP